ncbi:MAG: flagellar biosynthetic protein FliO [Candidatus Riflebacteria bacterium]|nr:flagellar biosynthetic protein FliO [Candidatus Riflebacteria bacterium]
MALGTFVAILLAYVVLVLLKSRVAGFRGDHMRVVDTIALSPTAHLALVEMYHGELYLVAYSNDRVSLLDRVTNAEVIERVRYPRGRPASAPEA